MKIEFNNPFKEFLGKDDTYNNAKVSSNNTKKKKSSKVYGKYYEEDVSAMEQRLSDIKDEKELREMQERWDIERIDLEEKISGLEKIVEQGADEESVVKAKISLHDLYEQYETCKKYEARLNSTAQLEFIKSVLGTYGFVPVTRADEIAKEYEDSTEFSSDEYKKKEKKAENWGLALSCIGLIITPSIVGYVWALVWNLIKFIYIVATGKWHASLPYGVDEFLNFPLMCLGGMILVYGIPVLNCVTTPAWFSFTFWMVQKLVNKVILGNRVSKLKEQRDKANRTGAVAAGAGLGISITADYMKNRKKKK
ncbi:MAG: hypothetical protein ACI4MA_07660 [Treponema sp.]